MFIILSPHVITDRERIRVTSLLPSLLWMWIFIEISLDGYINFVIFTDKVDIHQVVVDKVDSYLKVECFKQEIPLM